MPGTRTAPDITGTPAFIFLSMSFFGAGNEEVTVTFPFAGDATNAELEAVADVMQAGSNASMWQATVSRKFTGAKLVTNALNDVYPSVQDNVLITYKNPTTRNSERLYIPAPLESFIVAGTENVDTSAPVFTNILAAVAAALPSGYAPTTTRFTEHREVNEAQPIG